MRAIYRSEVPWESVRPRVKGPAYKIDASSDRPVLIENRKLNIPTCDALFVLSHELCDRLSCRGSAFDNKYIKCTAIDFSKRIQNQSTYRKCHDSPGLGLT